MSDPATSSDAAIKLPDPWRYGPGDVRNRPLQLAAAADAAPLAAAMRVLLEQRADEEIRRTLSLAPTREAYGRLWEALCAASAGAAAPGDAVIASVFAMPLVIVSGARHSAWLPGILSDVGALMDVLQRHGALGASRNVGFGNALCSLETLMQLPPSTIHGWSAPSSAAERASAIVPEPIPVRAGEEVHLRFLLGAAITPAAAPTVAETAAHIGAWGMPFTRALAAQIGVAGVELLTLPRPPCGVLKAGHAGRSAQLEVALNLFMSNAIKRLRAAAGEPALVISAHEAGASGAELRVSLSAALDDTLLEGYRWPLHPLDDPNEIARNVRQLAADCRLTDVRLVEAVLPEGGNGSPLFVRATDVPGMKH